MQLTKGGRKGGKNYSRKQLEEAFKLGMGAGIACAARGLGPEASWAFAKPLMRGTLDRFVAPELLATDRVEAIV